MDYSRARSAAEGGTHLTEYHLTLSDEERANIELSSFNYFTTYGAKMRLPPSLCFDLQVAGVSMKWIEPDAALEGLDPSQRPA